MESKQVMYLKIVTQFSAWAHVLYNTEVLMRNTKYYLTLYTQWVPLEQLAQDGTWDVPEFLPCRDALEVGEDVLLCSLSQLDQPIGLSQDQHIQTGAFIHSVTQEVNAERERPLQLELT